MQRLRHLIKSYRLELLLVAPLVLVLTVLSLFHALDVVRMSFVDPQQGGATLMHYRAKGRDILDMPWYHPTLSEVIMNLARDLPD